MFYQADFLTQQILNKKLMELTTPQLEFILWNYCNLSQNPANFFRQIQEIILNRLLPIRLAGTVRQDDRDYITIISSGSESKQFLGDYGDKMESQISPKIYEECAPISFDGSYYIFPKFAKIWKQQCIYLNKQLYQVEDLIITDDIKLKTSIQDGLNQKWLFVSPFLKVSETVNTSMDAVNISIDLVTTGDSQVHQAYQILLRYLLKSSRLDFEFHGLNTPTYSWSNMQLMKQADNNVFMTSFQLRGLMQDRWIQSIEPFYETVYEYNINNITINDGITPSNKVV